jgi:hypothetical protein
MEFLPPLPHLSTMDYKKGFAYFAADWGTLLFPNALGGYFELYGFLYDMIMQVIKDRLAAQKLWIARALKPNFCTGVNA